MSGGKRTNETTPLRIGERAVERIGKLILEIRRKVIMLRRVQLASKAKRSSSQPGSQRIERSDFDPTIGGKLIARVHVKIGSTTNIDGVSETSHIAVDVGRRQ